jgi:hypothetical protein
MTAGWEDFASTPIFRSVTPSAETTFYTPAGKRVPRSVPILIDNIWESLRPPGLPSRRSSAFGSPSPTLAAQFGPPGGVVGQVFIRPPCIIAQIACCSDASLHPDIDVASYIIHHSGLPIELIRKVSSRILAGNDVTELLAGFPGVQGSLREAVAMWSQCIEVPLGTQKAPDEIGEFIFEAPAGYHVELGTSRRVLE